MTSPTGSRMTLLNQSMSAAETERRWSHTVASIVTSTGLALAARGSSFELLPRAEQDDAIAIVLAEMAQVAAGVRKLMEQRPPAPMTMEEIDAELKRQATEDT